MDLRELISLLNGESYRSGEELGERFGVSRTAVWKQLKKLDALGVELDAVRGRGYRLKRPVEILDGKRMVERLSREGRRRLSRLFVELEIDSTNTLLLGRFKHGAGHQEVCFAERQTASRGRRGRSFEVALGSGLTFSLGWRFECAASALEGLSLAAGVAVAEALAAYNVDLMLKWPNDLLQRNAAGELEKVGGILVELQGDAEGPCDVVIGIGINVFDAPSLPPGQGLPAGYMAAQGGSLSRNALASSLIESIGAMLESFAVEGFGPWQQRWNQLNALAGEKITVYTGGTSYAAEAGGVDERGILEVVTDSGVRRLAGGEVTLRPLHEPS
ncbi:biotin--[acetyl-CoA-carboxylase] ligase [Carnimonas nigrificans]|uniref:biotin--[acetyl-CoA-carboxylase] ligase n=1 Tax=Carnimonas nigrificans TaxID=64323 RepID=UPI0004718C41|nr:biotin--[acetyl-CoA-carboxylase] ligase [Carnimonas nigrificans]